MLKELRELAEEVSDGHMEYAERFQELLRKVKNPNLPDVAKGFGFIVMSKDEARGYDHITVATAAWECACKIFPQDRWLLLWGGMVQYDSGQPGR